MRFLLIASTLALLTTPIYAAKCVVALEATDTMQFSKKEIVVDASCKKLELTLKHVGKLPKSAMGHNFVLTKTEDVSKVGADAIAAGLANEYLPKDRSKIIAATKLLGGGEIDTITFDISKLNHAASYTYFCSFPGHIGLMKGRFIIKKGS